MLNHPNLIYCSEFNFKTPLKGENPEQLSCVHPGAEADHSILLFYSNSGINTPKGKKKTKQKKKRQQKDRMRSSHE